MGGCGTNGNGNDNSGKRAVGEVRGECGGVWSIRALLLLLVSGVSSPDDGTVESTATGELVRDGDSMAVGELGEDDEDDEEEAAEGDAEGDGSKFNGRIGASASSLSSAR